MTDDTPTSGTQEEPAEAVVRGRRRFSIVWVLPIIAAIVGLGLAYRTYSQQGPDIQISFEKANGIDPGKTTIRFRDVEIGAVNGVTVSEDLSRVEVSATISKSMGKHLVEGTRFWVVRPRIGAMGISGLSTLVSGSYIGMDPGPPSAEASRKFVGLEEPPVDIAGNEGLPLTLVRDEIGGLSEGSPIFYRGIQVGEVVEYDLTKDKKHVQINVLIDTVYAPIVNSGTRFWDASGVDVSVGWKGVDVRMESLQSVLAGGVAFGEVGPKGSPAKKGDRFTVFSSKADAEHAFENAGSLRIIVDAPALASLEVGSPVYYREVPVGEVGGVSLHDDGRSIGVRLEIHPRYAALVRTNSVFANVSGISGNLGLSGVHVHMESLKALLSGGVAFATPNPPGPRAASGSVFELQPEFKDSWLQWKPQIWLGGGAGSSPGAKSEKAPEPQVVTPKSQGGRDRSQHSFGPLMKRPGHWR